MSRIVAQARLLGMAPCMRLKAAALAVLLSSLNVVCVRLLGRLGCR